MIRNKTLIITALILIGSAMSCVPKRQFMELEMKTDRSIRDRDSLKTINAKLTVEKTELESELALTKDQMNQARNKLTEELDSSRFYRSQYNVLKAMNDDLVRSLDDAVHGAETENRQMLIELQQLRSELDKREQRLARLQDSLEIERNNLNLAKMRLDDKNQILAAMDSMLQEKERSLEEKSQRIAELQNILEQKDAAVRALKENVSKALLGFENEGLSVTHRNGKVYVSLEEKLLFKSGQYTIDSRGKDALLKLAGVLEENLDVNIVIEGHTDDVPLNGKGNIQDNWDLSVKRATTVVKVLLTNKKLDPTKFMAAGRSKYHPVDNAKTATARAKNRRIEIILTPKLDELLRILEN